MKIRITGDDLAPRFLRLKAIYGYKNAWALKDAGSDEAKAFVTEWVNQLNATKIQPTELDKALDAWFAEERSGWPTPGDLKKLVWQSYGTAPRLGQVFAPENEMVWCVCTRQDGSTYHRYFPRDAMPHNASPA